MIGAGAEAAGRRFYLDDLHVGQRFASAAHAIDEAQIIAFAAQFDPQPFHLDDEAARATLFGGLAASGWHTAAITMRLNVEGGLLIASGIVGAGGEIAISILCQMTNFKLAFCGRDNSRGFSPRSALD